MKYDQRKHFHVACKELILILNNLNCKFELCHTIGPWNGYNHSPSWAKLEKENRDYPQQSPWEDPVKEWGEELRRDAVYGCKLWIAHASLVMVLCHELCMF